MVLIPHFHTEPVPDTEEHKTHLLKEYFRSKGIPTEEYNITTKGNKEVNHIWIEIK